MSLGDPTKKPCPRCRVAVDRRGFQPCPDGFDNSTFLCQSCGYAWGEITIPPEYQAVAQRIVDERDANDLIESTRLG